MGPLGPFGDTFERLGDTLINKVADEIFGSSDAARQTLVVIFNHMDDDLFFLDSSFASGGFTPGMQAPDTIGAKSAQAYRVESHGLATGVTGATVHYGLVAGDPTVALEIITSNPFGGDNHSEVQAFNGLSVTKRDSVGNANQVDLDVRS